MTTSSRRTKAGLVAGGALASVLLAGSFSGTLAGFTAQITNTTNTAGLGTLSLSETGQDTAGTTVTCVSTDATASCSSINKYGGNLAMKPGDTNTETLTFTNTGTLAATSFTLTGGACTQTGGTATDLCTQMLVTITAGGTQVYTGTAADLKSATLPALAANGSTTVTVVATMPSTLVDTYQGASISQPLTWTLAA